MKRKLILFAVTTAVVAILELGGAVYFYLCLELQVGEISKTIQIDASTQPYSSKREEYALRRAARFSNMAYEFIGLNRRNMTGNGIILLVLSFFMWRFSREVPSNPSLKVDGADAPPP